MGRFLPICSGAGKSLLPVPHPQAILVSIADCGRGPGALRNVLELIDISGAEKVFLDNGMFTFFKKWDGGELVIFDNTRKVYPKGISMNLTAQHNIYYARIVEPDVFIASDLPVKELINPNDVGEQEFNFMLCSYHNIIRARETVQLREQYSLKSELYFAFQGYNLNQLLRIWKELNGLHFDGFCLASRALNWNQMMAMMLMLNHLGVWKIHILAGSNLPAMAIGAFAARHLFEEVSYDSANWLTFSLLQDFRFFGGMHVVRLKSNLPLKGHLKSIHCNCQHCKGRSLEDIHQMPEGTEKQQLLAQHNFLIETQTAKALYDHCETPSMLRDFLLKHSYRRKLIMEIYQCTSTIYDQIDELKDPKIIRGFCEYIYGHFGAT